MKIITTTKRLYGTAYKVRSGKSTTYWLFGFLPIWRTMEKFK